jgi:hypothetical protein
MSKHRTAPATTEHPSWCNLKYREPNDHDMHLSVRERVGEDLPSNLVIDAYLLRMEKAAGVHPEAPLAALEFRLPGEQTTSYLMTFGQLRILEQALYRLVKLGEWSCGD